MLLQSWFYWGQVVFMVWNAVNDPLFALLQDKETGESNVQRYSRAIRFGGPVFALAFLAPWFVWPDLGPTSVGLLFLSALCIFDGAFTYVVLAQCALFTETETTDEGRSSLLALNAAAGTAGTIAYAGAFWLWTPCDGLGGFRIYALALAAGAALCFDFTGRVGTATVGVAAPPVKRSRSDPQVTSLLPGAAPAAAPVPDSQAVNVGWRTEVERLLKVMLIPDFLRFVCTNFLQIFQITFAQAFFPIFAPVVLAGILSPASQKLVLMCSTVCTPLCTGLLSSLIGHGRRYESSYYLIRTMFVATLGIGVALALFNGSATAVVCFMFLYPPLLGSTFSFFNMSLSDLIDADQVRHGRERRMGTTFFGVNALCTKPAQSAAPMIIVHTLSLYGYVAEDGGVDAGAMATLEADVGGNGAAVANDGETSVAHIMVRLLWVIPVLCSTAQLLLWRTYTLRSPEDCGREAAGQRGAAAGAVLGAGDAEDGGDDDGLEGGVGLSGDASDGVQAVHHRALGTKAK